MDVSDATAPASALAMAARPWHPGWQVDLVHARGGRAHSLRLSWDAHANRLWERAPAPFVAGAPVAGSQAALPLAGGGLPLRRLRPSRYGAQLKTAAAG